MVASWANKKGYRRVSLTVPGHRTPVLHNVHRLVLQSFGDLPIRRDDHDLQGDHEDEIRSHNALDNLTWTTPAGNMRTRGLLVSRPERERRGCAVASASATRCINSSTAQASCDHGNDAAAVVASPIAALASGPLVLGHCLT